jgi:hypothetical protein
VKEKDELDVLDELVKDSWVDDCNLFNFFDGLKQEF